MTDDPALAEPSRPNRALNTIVGLVVGAGLGLALGLLIGRDVVFQVFIGGALGAVVGALWHGPGLPSPPPPLARGERASLTSLADAFARALYGPTRTAFRACLVLFIPGASVLFTLLVVVDARLSSYMSAASIAVGLVLLVAVMVVLPPLLLDRSMRSAFAVLEWCGAHEWRRLAGSARAAASFPVTPEARQRWLTERFDPASPRAIDIEVLLLEGDVDTARGATAKLPTETPQDRFAKAEREEFVRYQETVRSIGRGCATQLPPFRRVSPGSRRRRASRAFRRALDCPTTTGSCRCSRRERLFPRATR